MDFRQTAAQVRPVCDQRSSSQAVERFIIFNGTHEPYIHPDHPVTRSEAVNYIVGDPQTFSKAISFEVGKPSIDKTSELVAEALNRWADTGEPLSRNAWEFVERFAGHGVARCFEMAE